MKKEKGIKMNKKLFLIIMSVLFIELQGFAALPVTSDLILSLNGDDVSTSGSLVLSWNDQSGRGNDAVATYWNPQLAADEANGYDAVDFAGDTILEIVGNSDFNDLTEFTLFVAYRYPDDVDFSKNLYTTETMCTG